MNNQYLAGPPFHIITALISFGIELSFFALIVRRLIYFMLEVLLQMFFALI